MKRKIGLLLVVMSVLWMAACGGSGGGSNSMVTAVSVSCSPTTVTSGGTSQCSASVTGSGNFSTGVTWSTSAGSISSSGTLTAPVVTTSLVVTVNATSTQNTSVGGTAFVTVNAMYSGRQCRATYRGFGTPRRGSEHCLHHGNSLRSRHHAVPDDRSHTG